LKKWKDSLNQKFGFLAPYANNANYTTKKYKSILSMLMINNNKVDKIAQKECKRWEVIQQELYNDTFNNLKIWKQYNNKLIIKNWEKRICKIGDSNHIQSIVMNIGIPQYCVIPDEFYDEDKTYYIPFYIDGNKNRFFKNRINNILNIDGNEVLRERRVDRHLPQDIHSVLFDSNTKTVQSWYKSKTVHIREKQGFSIRCNRYSTNEFNKNMAPQTKPTLKYEPNNKSNKQTKIANMKYIHEESNSPNDLKAIIKVCKNLHALYDTDEDNKYKVKNENEKMLITVLSAKKEIREILY